MTFLFVGTAVLFSVLPAAIGLARHSTTAVVSLQPRAEPYQSIRMLHGADEVRDAARRAYERERFIAHAVDRRAAHFRELAIAPAISADR